MQQSVIPPRFKTISAHSLTPINNFNLQVICVQIVGLLGVDILFQDVDIVLSKFVGPVTIFVAMSILTLHLLIRQLV